jgi:hypothetical protein
MIMGLDMEIVVNGYYPIYMRKSNAIRRWFANNLDNFKDNGLTNVPKEKFKAIIDIMYQTINKSGIRGIYDNYILENENENEDIIIPDSYNMIKQFVENGGKDYKKFCEIAAEMFPTQAGFFFGKTDYGVSYIWDLIVYHYKFKNLYDTLSEDDEVEWKDDTVHYWEWY